MTARQSRHPPARSWSPGSARAGANGASSTRPWKPTRSASSPISPGRDARSPRGRNALPGCAGRRSSSASPVTRPSTRAPSPLSRYSHRRATCIERCPRGSDRGPAEKGLPHGRHLAAGLPVLLRSRANTLVSVRQVTQRKNSFNPRRPRGLLEPCAATSGTHGSEGAGARQRVPATRLPLTRLTGPGIERHTDSICEYSQEWRLVRDYLASRYLHASGRVAAVIARR